MTLRKFLLLTYHFPPSAAVAVHRMLGLVKHLPNYGWQPIVVAPPKVPWEPEDPSLLAQVPPGTIVERVPFPGGFFGKVQRKLAPTGHWLPRAWSACRRLIRLHRPEAIFTSSPPTAVNLLGLALQMQTGLPWLACQRDPWVTQRLHDTEGLSKWFDPAFERRMVRRASFVITNTPLLQQGFEEAYPQEASKFVMVTNGFEPSPYPSPTIDPAKPQLTLVHAGELYIGRDPRRLFDAMVALRQEGILGPEELKLNLLGRASESSFEFGAEIRNRQLDQSVFHLGQVPHAEALQHLSKADILIVIHSPGWRICVPAKVYEYLAAGKPILALAERDSDIAWVLRESSVLHRVAPIGDAAAIQEALTGLIQDIRQGVPVIRNAGALQAFTRESMAQRVAECLDRATAAAAVSEPATAGAT